MKILVCGEALLDVFAAAQDTPTGLQLDARVGGSPFNVALGLARMGRPVALFGGISTDFLGARLLRALASEGVDTAAIVRVDAPTTLSLVGLDETGQPSYSFYGHGTADRSVDGLALATLASDWAAIHLGSYAMVVDPTAATLRRLVERQRATSLIAYDPNVRLSVEPDLGAWRTVLHWMLRRAHVVKVSSEDLEALEPGTSADQFARRALACGVRLVVVTRGGEGASAWAEAAHAEVPAVPLPVVDTVGAGDTFQAALLTWLAEQGRLGPEACRAWAPHDLRALLRFASQAAAITCSRRGADLPRRDELPPG